MPWAEGISPRLFNEPVLYSLYVDMRMSTTASHGFKNPLEIIRGVVPDITKLHRGYTCSVVRIPRQKLAQETFSMETNYGICANGHEGE